LPFDEAWGGWRGAARETHGVNDPFPHVFANAFLDQFFGPVGFGVILEARKVENLAIADA
jgi:hypothetical protein